MLNRLAFVTFALLCIPAAAHAQDTPQSQPSTTQAPVTAANTAILDAPGALSAAQASAASTQPPPPDQPSKRILGLIPNYRAVPVGATLPRQTVLNKFITAGQDTIDPSSFALSAVIAGVDYAGNATPEFHRGGVAFGRYYWHELADQSVENMAVEFLVPALTREDTRYYTMGTGGARKRLVYSLTRTFVVRSDSGKETFNAGEVVGAGLAAFASSRYYPASQKTASSILGQYALDLGIDAGSYVLREFDSDLIRSLSHRRSGARP